MKVLIFSMIISLFSGLSYAESRLLEVYSVSDYDFTLNNKQAVSIAFGESQSNYCSITLIRGAAIKGYSVNAKKNNDKNVSVDCSWNNKDYVQSSKHKTFVDLSVKSLDNQIKVSDIRISLKLVNAYSGEFFSLDKVKINITNAMFENLVK